MSNYTKVMSYHISNIFKKQLINKKGDKLDENQIKDLAKVWPVNVDKPKNVEKLTQEFLTPHGEFFTTPTKLYSSITYADGKPQLHEIILLSSLIDIHEKIVLLEDDDRIQFLSDGSVIIETSYDEIQYLINFRKSLINSSLSGLEELNLIKIMRNGLKGLSIKFYMNNIIKISNYDVES